MWAHLLFLFLVTHIFVVNILLACQLLNVSDHFFHRYEDHFSGFVIDREEHPVSIIVMWTDVGLVSSAVFHINISGGHRVRREDYRTSGTRSTQGVGD